MPRRRANMRFLRSSLALTTGLLLPGILGMAGCRNRPARSANSHHDPAGPASTPEAPAAKCELVAQVLETSVFDFERGTLVAWPDGRVVIVGGVDRKGSDGVVAFDPVSKTTATLGTLTKSMVAPTATRLSTGELLVVTLESAELFDPRTGSSKALSGDWPRLPTMVAVRDGNAVVGGWYHAWTFDRSSLELQEIRDVPSINFGRLGWDSRRSSRAFALSDDLVVFVAGTEQHGDVIHSLSRAVYFDVTARRFGMTEPFAADRMYSLVPVQRGDGTLFIYGHHHRGQALLRFVPETRAFEVAVRVDTRREHDAAGPLVDGRIVVTGRDGTVVVLDPDRATYTEHADLLLHLRRVNTSTPIDGTSILVTGGHDDDRHYAELVRCLPAEQAARVRREVERTSIPRSARPGGGVRCTATCPGGFVCRHGWCDTCTNEDCNHCDAATGRCCGADGCRLCTSDSDCPEDEICNGAAQRGEAFEKLGGLCRFAG